MARVLDIEGLNILCAIIRQTHVLDQILIFCYAKKYCHITHYNIITPDTKLNCINAVEMII